MSEIRPIRVRDVRFEGVHETVIINTSDFTPGIHTLVEDMTPPEALPKSGTYCAAHEHQVGPEQPKKISGLKRCHGRPVGWNVSGVEMNPFWERCRFFSCPESLIEAGHLTSLTPEALRLYLGALLVSSVRSAPVVTIIPELQTLLDLTDDQVKSASAELRKANLVLSCSDGSLHLLNPESAMPLWCTSRDATVAGC